MLTEPVYWLQLAGMVSYISIYTCVAPAYKYALISVNVFVKDLCLTYVARGSDLIAQA